ncbi:hypothetical protein AU468_13430 [Alkalispirochaeta sphaeroplastigenens]|uniref:Uncharacterized protein n=1 Tax=Alkalispirochaeta sphaeroplastigenens TaxID=1187066 RepID=A0A2S4JFQ8_9SPIO|nr:hypothetical protein [Alkalispirochaeta sphaeroplastigenens]POQ98353.1 hypothetical protein AU468_13430 [Alkalispirochaeta sphaeroplastigenens]
MKPGMIRFICALMLLLVAGNILAGPLLDPTTPSYYLEAAGSSPWQPRGPREPGLSRNLFVLGLVGLTLSLGFALRRPHCTTDVSVGLAGAGLSFTALWRSRLLDDQSASSNSSKPSP